VSTVPSEISLGLARRCLSASDNPTPAKLAQVNPTAARTSTGGRPAYAGVGVKAVWAYSLAPLAIITVVWVGQCWMADGDGPRFDLPVVTVHASVRLSQQVS